MAERNFETLTETLKKHEAAVIGCFLISGYNAPIEKRKRGSKMIFWLVVVALGVIVNAGYEIYKETKRINDTMKEIHDEWQRTTIPKVKAAGERASAKHWAKIEQRHAPEPKKVHNITLKVRFPKKDKISEPVKSPKDFSSKTMRKGQAEVIARNIKANYKTIHSQAKPAKKKQTIHDKIAAEELIQKKLMKLFRDGMPKHQFQIQKEQSDKRLLNLKQQLKGA